MTQDIPIDMEPDPWLVQALTDIRAMAALPDAEAYPALQGYLDRWQMIPEGEDGPVMGDLLGDPDWERRELRTSIIKLRAALGNEIRGGAKILTWHAKYLRTEADRLARDYPTAALEAGADVTLVVREATRRAVELEARIEALPRRRRSGPK